MVDEVIDAFKKRIRNNHTWIDDSTKEHVLAKVNRNDFCSLIQTTNHAHLFLISTNLMSLWNKRVSCIYIIIYNGPS